MKEFRSRLPPREWLLAVILLLTTVALLYGHTLSAPMYLDDHGALLGNYRLRDLPATLAQFFRQRGLTNLTFALNFQLSGWDLAPLHLTNITLHALCGLLVWLLLRQLLQRPWLALFGALLFVAHPLQTQAVTYLVQRSVLLSSCLVVAALLCHRQSREALAGGAARTARLYLQWQLGALLCGAGAILAKENTVILPLLLIAHDQLFPLPLKRSLRQAVYDYLPYFATVLLLGGGIFLSLAGSGQVSLPALANLSLQHNSSLHYLVTQFSVFWIYLRLLLLPYGQGLEYDYPVVAELLTWQNAVALTGLITLGWLVWRLRRHRPLLTFGAVWFVLALAVESSIIPLDPIFEHRLYLPMFGFVLILLDGLPALLGEKRAWVLLGIALLIWMPLSWRRNDLWNDPLRFNEQNLRVAPQSPRVYLALVYNYRDAGRSAEAERCAKEILRINPRFNVAYEELALLYAARSDMALALATVEEGLTRLPGDPRVYKAGANVYLGMGQPQAAVEFLQRGVTAAPKNAVMLDQLAALEFELGKLSEAETAYRKSLQLQEAAPATHRNLGKVLYSQGRMAEALTQVRRALQLEPGDPDTWEGLGMTALALGDIPVATTAAERLERIDGDGALRLRAALAAAGLR